MTLRVFIQPDRTGEEAHHALLLRNRQRLVRQRTGSNRTLGRPKRIAHQLDSYDLRLKASGETHGNLDLAEGLKNGRIIFTAQKRRVHLVSNSGM